MRPAILLGPDVPAEAKAVLHEYIVVSAKELYKGVNFSPHQFVGQAMKDNFSVLVTNDKALKASAEQVPNGMWVVPFRGTDTLKSQIQNLDLGPTLRHMGEKVEKVPLQYRERQRHGY